MITIPKIELFTEAILPHAKLCNMYKVYCMNYISIESEVNYEKR